MEIADTIITEELTSKNAPDQTIIQSVITCWLIKELSKDWS